MDRCDNRLTVCRVRLFGTLARILRRFAGISETNFWASRRAQLFAGRLISAAEMTNRPWRGHHGERRSHCYELLPIKNTRLPNQCLAAVVAEVSAFGCRC